MFMPIGLIAISLTMASITVTLAVTDEAMVAAPEYYDNAVRWDEHRAQLAANGALQWRVTPELRDGVLTLRVEDKHGVPITNARVRVELIPALEPGLRSSIDAVECEGGAYTLPWPAGPAGRWQILTRVEQGGTVYTDHTERLIRSRGGHADD